MTWRQGRALWLAIMLAAGNSSCASFYWQDKTCHWLELEESQGLEVTAPRVAVPPWAECTSVNAPGYYRLRRADYTVEFWNGDRGDHQDLYLRVLDGGGTHLTVESRQFDGEPNARLRGNRTPGVEYDYYLFERLRVYEPGSRIEFTVRNAQGLELGRESLKVVSKSGGKYRESRE